MKKLLLIMLVLATPFMAMAQLDLGLYGVGGQIGYVMPEGDIENPISFGANLDIGSFGENIDLYAYVNYWGKSYDVGEYYEWSYSILSIAAIARYPFEMQGSLKPYAGAGLGFEIASWDSKYTGPTYGGYITAADYDYSDSSTDLGIHLLGGAEMEINEKMTGFGEVRYTISDVDYFGIYVGVTYSLGK